MPEFDCSTPPPLAPSQRPHSQNCPGDGKSARVCVRAYATRFALIVFFKLCFASSGQQRQFHLLPSKTSPQSHFFFLPPPAPASVCSEENIVFLQMGRYFHASSSSSLPGPLAMALKQKHFKSIVVASIHCKSCKVVLFFFF